MIAAMDAKTLAQSVSAALGSNELTVSERIGASAPSSFHSDSWSNLVTNLGVNGKDKRLGAVVQSASLSYEQAGEAYRGDDMTQAIIDIPAGEMVREWADLRIEGNEKDSEAVGAIVDKKLKAREIFRKGIKWQRLYGGAGILIGVNDGRSLDQPVNEAAIRSVDYLNVFDPAEIRPIDWESNPAKADYGEPKMYQIFPRVFGVGAAVLFEKVHCSRVVRLNGITANRIQAAYNFGWGDSVLDRCYEVIRDFAQAFHGTAALLQDFAQGVFKLRGLAAAMGSDREKLIQKRIQLIDFCRSMLRAVVVDAEGEDFERKSTSVAGLDGILDRFSVRLAAAARIPMAKLFCETPGGMSDGKLEGPLELWHKEINADQEKEISPGLTKITRYVMLSKGSPTGGKEPDNYAWIWRPLSELSQPEEANRNLAQAQADAIYLTNGVLGPDTIRTSRFGGDKFSLDTVIEDDAEILQTAPEATVTRLDEEGHPVEVKPGETAGAFSVGSRVIALADHMKGMKGAKGVIAVARSGTPPYYAVDFDEPMGEGNPHKWLAEDEIKADVVPAKKQAMGSMSGESASPDGKAPQNASTIATAGKPGGAGGLKAQDTALNGTQISSALQILKDVAGEQIPRDSGIQALVSLLFMKPEEAEKMMGEIGKGFKPKAPEVSPDVLAMNAHKEKLAAVTPPPPKAAV